MITKVHLLAVVAALLVAIAAGEGLLILRAPAVSPSPLGEGGPASGPGEGLRPTTHTPAFAASAADNPSPVKEGVPASGPGEGLLLHPSPLGEGGPASGPGEGLMPQTADPALAASESPAASAAPAELSPAEKAAQKDADYRHALEVLADQQIDQFAKMLDLTDDQRKAAAPIFAKAKTAGVNLQLTNDQLQHQGAHAAAQPAVLAQPADNQSTTNLMNQMAAQMNDLNSALGELRPLLTDQQTPKLDALLVPMQQAQKQIQDAQAKAQGAAAGNQTQPITAPKN